MPPITKKPIPVVNSNTEKPPGRAAGPPAGWPSGATLVGSRVDVLAALLGSAGAIALGTGMMLVLCFSVVKTASDN